MISSETSSAGGAAGSAHAWWSSHCIALMVAVLFLVTPFVLKDAPAGTGEPIFINNHAASVKEDFPISTNGNISFIKMHEPAFTHARHVKDFSAPSPQPCSSDKPGVCS